MQREPSREAFKVLARRLGLAGREIAAQNKSVYGHSFGVDTPPPCGGYCGGFVPPHTQRLQDCVFNTPPLGLNLTHNFPVGNP